VLALRDYALSQDINLIMVNFDPTDSKLAHLYITCLGFVGRRYTIAYYGQSSSPLHKNLQTDRLHAEWWIHSSHMQQQGDVYEKLLSSEEEHIDEVRLPVEMEAWKRAGDARATKVQEDIRKKLTTAFEQGLAIFGFRRELDGTGIYQLGSYKLIKQVRMNQKHFL
jgi:predicted GNAT superfamily acetyltransferase